MTFSSCCRVTAPLLFSLLAMAGCGGVGHDVADVVGAMADGIVCGLRNCTESSTLNVDEISPRFSAAQATGDNRVVVDGFLGKSANVLTTVLMAPDERLSVSIDGGPEVTMSNPDGERLGYTASLAAASAQPVVQLVFTRAGVRHVSQVTLPVGFTVLQPTGNPLLTRSGAALPVRLNLSGVNDAVATGSGSCSRSDGSSFTIKNENLGARIEGSVAGGYRLEPALVDDNLNIASRNANNSDPKTAAVSRCELTVTWTKSSRGTIAPTMNGHGTFLGERQASHPLVYDARS
ncbi:hypothetical protein [Roseateles sp. P5_E11]